MRDKVLIDVMLPATRRHYEFRVPLDSTVEEAAMLISRILEAREPALYQSTGDSDLMLLGEGMAGEELNPNELVRVLVEQGVLSDGVHVALA